MKFALFTFSGEGMSVAYQVKLKGYEVVVGQIIDEEETLTKAERGTHKPERAEDKRLRLSMFDGMLTKISAKALLARLLRVREKDRKDWYTMCDLNTCFKYGEALQKERLDGNFPIERDRHYEVNRSDANEFVREHYPGVRVGEYREFRKATDGQKFLKVAKVPFVLKSMGDAGDTIVAPDDPEASRDLLIDQLGKHSKDYEQMGFILEEKIVDFVELTPEMMFWNGKPLMTTLDIENKTIGSGNIGISMGCMQNLVVQTSFDDPLNAVAFPEIVHEMAKDRPGLSIFDISFLIDKQGRLNFGEFCFNRYGWDAFPAELSMAGGATEFFESVKAGEYPLRSMYGAAIRVLNMDKSGRAPEGKLVEYKGKREDEVCYFDVKKVNGVLRTAGWQWDQAVITGSGNSVKDAVERTYRTVKDYHFVDKYYRPREDFLSTEYGTSIMNRLKYATDKKLI